MVHHNQGYEIIYDGVSSTTIPEYLCDSIERQMVGARRDTFETVGGMPGAWLFAEQPGLREIRILSHVLADTWPVDRRAAVRAVARWVEKAKWCKLILGDEPDVFSWAILSASPNVIEWRQVGTFEIAFMASPYTNDLIISTDSEVASTATDTFNIQVDGDVYSEPVIIITAAGALNSGDPDVNPTLKFTMNGRTLIYNETIPAAGKVTLNGISKTVTLGDSIDTDLIGLFDPEDSSMENVSGLFPYLLPGANVLTVEAPISGYTVEVKWRNRYR